MNANLFCLTLALFRAFLLAALSVLCPAAALAVEFEKLPRSEAFFLYEGFTRENELAWRIEIFPHGPAVYTGVREVRTIGVAMLRTETTAIKPLYDFVRRSQFVELPPVITIQYLSSSSQISARYIFSTPDTLKRVVVRGFVHADVISDVFAYVRKAIDFDEINGLRCPWVQTRIGHPNEGMEKCSGKTVSEELLRKIRESEKRYGHQ